MESAQANGPKNPGIDGGGRRMYLELNAETQGTIAQACA